jgi:hypothetical protein
VKIPGGVPERLRAPLGFLVGCIAEANGHIRHALRNLSEREKRDLIEGLPQWATGTPLVKFSFVRQRQPDPRHLLGLLQKANLSEIRTAGVRLARQVETALPVWRSLSSAVRLAGTQRFTVDGVKVELSGQGDDEHASLDSSLCIDLGGRNHFSGRYGAGVGYASVLIDCGQSTFDVPDLSVGTGVLGIGLAYELNGHGDFRGHSLCFGSGVAGIGALFVDGGESRFRSISLSQGFGFFGAGLLMDTGGSDSFRADLYAEGAARTQGLGWLIAQKGNDVFRCGGLVPSPSGHSSCGQGYASGFAGAPMRSGGCGLLTAFGSNNVYVGEDHCQAAADLGGIGSTFDSGGSGTRAATEKAQGFADRQSGAFLYDLGSDDSSSCKQGACHGFANRLSVAFVLSRGDRNLWASKDGEPASGSGGSASIFVNDGAETCVTGEPGQDLVFGRLHSVGLFCSASGAARVLAEAPLEVTVRGSGVSYQRSSAPESAEPLGGVSGPPESNPANPPPSTASSADVFEVRRALEGLAAGSDPGAVGAASALIGSKDLLVRMGAIDVLAKFPSEGLPIADSLIAKGDEASQRTAVRLLGALGSHEALDRVAKLLLSSVLRGVLVDCLEAMNGRIPEACLAKVSELRNSSDSLIRSVARSVYVDR